MQLPRRCPSEKVRYKKGNSEHALNATVTLRGKKTVFLQGSARCEVYNPGVRGAVLIRELPELEYAREQRCKRVKEESKYANLRGPQSVHLTSTASQVGAKK